MTTTYVNAAGVQFVRDLLAHIPRPDLEAARCIGEWARNMGLELDPLQTDVVTLHYRGKMAVVASRMSLTQALLTDWQGESGNNLIGSLIGAPWASTPPWADTFIQKMRIVETLPPLGPLHNGAAYSVFNGLFRRADPPTYGHGTYLNVPAEDLQRFIWNLDFHSHFKATLDSYWTDHLANHRLAAKIAFIAACNKQVSQGSLGEAGRELAWQAAGLSKRSAGLKIRPLNIYGYVATDVLCIADQAVPGMLLYIPGNASPLHMFPSMEAMKDWVALQCRSDDTRKALRSHFRLADTPDGLDFSGLDTALDGLAAYPGIHHLSPNRPGFTTDGRWAPHDYVNYRASTYSAAIEGDIFQALSEFQRQRSLDDADFIITSNSDVTKAKWRGYLTTTLNLLAPLALLVPELAPLFALGGVAQFGLGVDQAINGKSLDAKADAVGYVEFGLLNALPMAAAAGLKATELFSIKRDGFVFPTWVNERWGYPLSPVSPPHLPELDVADYFVINDAIAPLPGGDPAVAESVIRQPLYNGELDELQASSGGYGFNVMYDMERDAFIADIDANAVMPTFYIAKDGNMDLTSVDAMTRSVTDAMRMRTLRSLGVDLPLPVELPTLETERVQAIPKRISSIWVGNKVIDAKLLDNLAANAQRLAGSEYRYRLFLSNASPVAFAENTRLLAEQASGVEVLTLEEHAFYASFKESPYFTQYQHAIDGNGGVASNFSSASDVLRYPLLDHEGGLYMDIDDTLLGAHEDPLRNPQQPAPQDMAAIDNLTLATTPEGLLLPPPMSNQKLTMNWEYNSSLIGSHPGNPTLRAISDEMHARYLAEPDFYDSRPDIASDSRGFYLYAARLNRMTGPRLLTDVVDRQLPGLGTLRQIFNLYAMQLLNADLFIPRQSFSQSWSAHLPLNRIARTGGNHSWTHT
ncbi:dermonecrotic toxin domain-containing protein [Pseudomonas sp. NPDC089396]|uniref:dermonecrotic toxin domain-containing protein n=1 Tax=Pseudomonas sp. NPDC089396 TaxID=3364461 RepID=UPI00383662F4